MSVDTNILVFLNKEDRHRIITALENSAHELARAGCDAIARDCYVTMTKIYRAELDARVVDDAKAPSVATESTVPGSVTEFIGRLWDEREAVERATPTAEYSNAAILQRIADMKAELDNYLALFRSRQYGVALHSGPHACNKVGCEGYKP